MIKGYEITYRARRFKYRRALATAFFTSKRAAERYAWEHFTASEQARVRVCPESEYAAAIRAESR